MKARGVEFVQEPQKADWAPPRFSRTSMATSSCCRRLADTVERKLKAENLGNRCLRLRFRRFPRSARLLSSAARFLLKKSTVRVQASLAAVLVVARRRVVVEAVLRVLVDVDLVLLVVRLERRFVRRDPGVDALIVRRRSAASAAP
jgi:hypothetical protein